MLLSCPECGLSYFPEQGYYVGAMIINYVATTACVVTIFLVSLLFPDFTTLSTIRKFCLDGVCDRSFSVPGAAFL